MSTLYLVTIIAGLAAAAIFLAGFARGLLNAISEYRSGVPEPDDVPDEKLGLTAAFSVVISALVIAGVGFLPSLVYLGPFLAIGTAVACGIAFFIEKKSAP